MNVRRAGGYVLVAALAVAAGWALASLNDRPATDSPSPLTAFAGRWYPDTASDLPASSTGGEGPPLAVALMLPRFRPQVAARIAAARRPDGPAPLPDYCRPVTFTGPVGYGLIPVAVVSVAFEVLESPGRLILLDEFNLVRRIYLSDTPPPDALDVSDAGTSVAAFEGSTLVVKTTGLNPGAQVILGMPATALGRGASVVERFTPVGTDELEIITTVTAPELYAAPVTTTNRYRRQHEELVPLTACVDNDRAVDAASRSERFDITPPADLPPPPSM